MGAPAGTLFVELGLDLTKLPQHVAKAERELDQAAKRISRKSQISLTAAGDLGEGAPSIGDIGRGRAGEAIRKHNNRMRAQLERNAARRHIAGMGMDPLEYLPLTKRERAQQASTSVIDFASDPIGTLRKNPALMRAGLIGGGIAAGAFAASFSHRQGEANFRDYRSARAGMEFSGMQGLGDPMISGFARQATAGSTPGNSLLRNTLGRLPFIGTEIEKQFDRAANAAGKLASAYGHATQLTLQSSVRVAAASGRPIEALMARQGIEMNEATLNAERAGRGMMDTIQAGKFMLETDETFGNRKRRAIDTTKQAQSSVAALENAHKLEAEIESEAYSARLGMHRAGIASSMMRTRAADQRFRGDSVRAFATGLAADEGDFFARQRAEIAPLRGEERNLVLRRQTFDTSQMRAERSNRMLEFVAGMPNAMSASGFDMLGAGAMGQVRMEQVKNIEGILTQMLKHLADINADGGLH